MRTKVIIAWNIVVEIRCDGPCTHVCGHRWMRYMLKVHTVIQGQAESLWHPSGQTARRGGKSAPWWLQMRTGVELSVWVWPEKGERGRERDCGLITRAQWSRGRRDRDRSVTGLFCCYFYRRFWGEEKSIEKTGYSWREDGEGTPEDNHSSATSPTAVWHLFTAFVVFFTVCFVHCHIDIFL